ncbi:Trafficking protein particle complex subunit 2 [Galdieria sulphuraria]|uniref:Trafficking protein particle complex subunit 2 n=1 Tax=Galdieria sulphuraria TaxID=130081 RepID=M2XG91_GALSU|nr:hypothetical protein Gasu_34560 isoform 1 [Galdieria sulphuraria]EME29062.1 hypothetical protein isoform 1 [Galdieria sulphuraria]GJD12733.1 Trafficking protein particle complex subunit 2 [Galdieria sulphuraria]|eukprot:XP_005705582.1 hypothetical protein isoform 1 [Galdieria sulphuraria]
MAITFVIVSPQDQLLYEATFPPVSQTDETAHLREFILFASLDILEQVVWSTRDFYLKAIDRFNDQIIYGLVTASSVRLLLVSDGKSEEAVKNFLQEAYELYVKLALNPFFEPCKPILSTSFHERIQKLGKKYFV